MDGVFSMNDLRTLAEYRACLQPTTVFANADSLRVCVHMFSHLVRHRIRSVGRASYPRYICHTQSRRGARSDGCGFFVQAKVLRGADGAMVCVTSSNLDHTCAMANHPLPDKVLRAVTNLNQSVEAMRPIGTMARVRYRVRSSATNSERSFLHRVFHRT